MSPRGCGCSRLQFPPDDKAAVFLVWLVSVQAHRALQGPLLPGWMRGSRWPGPSHPAPFMDEATPRRRGVSRKCRIQVWGTRLEGAHAAREQVAVRGGKSLTAGPGGRGTQDGDLREQQRRAAPRGGPRRGHSVPGCHPAQQHPPGTRGPHLVLPGSPELGGRARALCPLCSRVGSGATACVRPVAPRQPPSTASVAPREPVVQARSSTPAGSGRLSGGCTQGPGPSLEPLGLPGPSPEPQS